MSLVCIFAVKAMLILIECKYIILEEQRENASNDAVPLIHSKHDSPYWDDEDDVRMSNGFAEKHRTRLRSDDKKTAKKVSEYLTYSDVGFHAAGVMGQRLVDVAVIISQIGMKIKLLQFYSH